MAHPFDGIQEKLDRARAHLEALRDELKTINPGEFYDTEMKVRAKRDKRGRRVVEGYLKIIREPDLKLGVIAGDWAHNLRGALDHLVYQLAILDSKGLRPPSDTTFFPIARAKGEYFDPGPYAAPSMRDKALAGVSEAHRTPIDNAQPYRGRTRADADRSVLAVLGAFANTDKHRVIQRAAIKPKSLVVTPYDNRVVVEGETEILKGPIADGAKVYTLRFSGLPAGTNVDVHVEFNYELGFGNRALPLQQLAHITFEVTAFVKNFRHFWD